MAKTGGEMGKHGVTSETPQNILLGAGTIHKDLQWKTNKFEGAIIGATSGGNSLEIKGEVKDIEIDGAHVKVKGLAVMQGGTAKMEVNFAEVNEDVIKYGMIASKSTSSDATDYDLFEPKATIEEGDYIQNLGFVGKTADGKKDIIVIFENGLCTSGLKLEGKDKENAVIKLEIEAYANNEGGLDKLPVKIYYPKSVAAAAAYKAPKGDKQ